MKSQVPGATVQRNNAVDVARGLGIALVFYGHFAEKLSVVGSAPALAQWKVVYAFHMPLFFFLAGLFWRPRSEAWTRWLLAKLRTRLLPVLSFSVLLLPLWAPMLAANGEWPKFLNAYLHGQPLLNWTTWFLVCLFMVEAWVDLLAHQAPLQRSDGALIGAGIALMMGIAVVAVASHLDLPTRKTIGSWFVVEGIVAAPFYLFGLVCRRAVLAAADVRRDGVVLLVSGTLLLATFESNSGLRPEPVVVMATLNHGQWYWFYTTAAAGIGFAVSACRLLGRFVPPLAVVGRRSLVYLGLAGMSFSLIESGIIAGIGWVPSSAAGVGFFCTAYVCGALLLWFPVAYSIERWAPQAFGVRRDERV